MRWFSASLNALFAAGTVAVVGTMALAQQCDNKCGDFQVYASVDGGIVTYWQVCNAAKTVFSTQAMGPKIGSTKVYCKEKCADGDPTSTTDDIRERHPLNGQRSCAPTENTYYCEATSTEGMNGDRWGNTKVRKTCQVSDPPG